jgi:uncharacterized membrane protein YfcA
MLTYLGFIALGLLAGLVGGFAGVGGGIIIIPALVLLFGYDQLKAQGTSLTVLLMPVALLAALQYWRNPEVHIDWRAAVFIGMGVFFGGLVGGRFANNLDPALVRKCFSVLIGCACVYLFFKK